MSRLTPDLEYSEFVTAALAARTEAGFRASPFFRQHGPALETLLRTPRPVGSTATAESWSVGPAVESSITSPGADSSRTAAGEFRLVHWNIEKGKELDRILRRLREDDRLATADAWCFNEVDDGMARSGNLDIAGELARALGARGFFLPTYVECTKGLPRERLVPGENRLGLHGLAILTRLPIGSADVFELPPTWDYFAYSEKRLGGRRALRVRLKLNGARLDLTTTHLEMRSPPAARAIQIRSLLDQLEAASSPPAKAAESGGGAAVPGLIAGDLNTHTFSRGRRGDTLRGFLRVVGTEARRLESQLRHPELSEPLFRHVADIGWIREGFNDDAPTAWQDLGSVEDLKHLPPALGRLVLQSFKLKGRRLPLRLDWVFGRGVEPLEAATCSSEVAGVGPASDHEPIWARVRLKQPGGVDRS